MTKTTIAIAQLQQLTAMTKSIIPSRSGKLTSDFPSVKIAANNKMTLSQFTVKKAGKDTCQVEKHGGIVNEV